MDSSWNAKSCWHHTDAIACDGFWRSPKSCQVVLMSARPCVKSCDVCWKFTVQNQIQVESHGKFLRFLIHYWSFHVCLVACFSLYYSILFSQYTFISRYEFHSTLILHITTQRSTNYQFSIYQWFGFINLNSSSRLFRETSTSTNLSVVFQPPSRDLRIFNPRFSTLTFTNFNHVVQPLPSCNLGLSLGLCHHRPQFWGLELLHN